MIRYEIDPAAHLVTCQVTGNLRALDVANFIERLWQDPRFDQDYNTLVEVNGETITPDLIARNALAELLLAWRKLHIAAKWAFVLPGSAWQRIAAQLTEEYELDGRNICCFPDSAAAMPWLQVSGLPEQTV